MESEAAWEAVWITFLMKVSVPGRLLSVRDGGERIRPWLSMMQKELVLRWMSTPTKRGLGIFITSLESLPREGKPFHPMSSTASRAIRTPPEEEISPQDGNKMRVRSTHRVEGRMLSKKSPKWCNKEVKRSPPWVFIVCQGFPWLSRED